MLYPIRRIFRNRKSLADVDFENVLKQVEGTVTELVSCFGLLFLTEAKMQPTFTFMEHIARIPKRH